jgi:HEAT repeat protein
MKTLRTQVMRAAAVVAALTVAPPLALAGQMPEANELFAPQLRAQLEALSSALRDAQDRVYAAQRQNGQSRMQVEQARVQVEQNRGEAQWDVLYERARQAIEQAQWSLAVQQFTTLSQAKSPRADAASYWRAYALDKMNRHSDALSAVGELFRNFPCSRWVADARALELQVRQRSGQPVPVESADDELKLLALQGLQQTAPDRAVPLLVKVINADGSLRLKERALFVLSQSSAPEARVTIEKVARGTANPELQLKAVQYIAMSGQPERVTILNNVYAGAADLEVKRQVLRAFSMAGDRQRVLSAAQNEKSPELRIEAVRQLGMMGGKPGVQTLTTLYTKESDVEVRRAIIEALSFQGDADVLVSMARKETNPELRREIVRRLSFIGSPAAVEYLTEILK